MATSESLLIRDWSDDEAVFFSTANRSRHRLSGERYPVIPTPADKSPIAWYPELNVLVGGVGTKSLALWGKLDIGADHCIIPSEIMDSVGAARYSENGFTIDYAGQLHPVEYRKVKFQVQIGSSKIKWSAIVAVDRARKEGTALWGRCGFMDHFNVTFRVKYKCFIIRLRDPNIPTFTTTQVAKTKAQKSSKSDLITRDEQNP